MIQPKLPSKFKSRKIQRGKMNAREWEILFRLPIVIPVLAFFDESA